MMGLPLGMVVEGLVSVLLVITIVYAVVLNERLKKLHADRDALRQTVTDLIQATDKANSAIVGLRQTATEAELVLTARLDEADRFAVELANHVTAGQAVMGRIAKILEVTKTRDAHLQEEADKDRLPINRAQEALKRLRTHQMEKGEAA